MADADQREHDDRTGEHGEDGAREHEREGPGPGEATGKAATPTERRPAIGATQAERERDKDLATGEENPA